MKPTGASLTAFSSAMALMALLIGLELENEENEDDFHGTRVRSRDFGVAVVAGVRRPAWVSMVILNFENGCLGSWEILCGKNR